MNEAQRLQLEQQRELWGKYSVGWKKWNDLMTAAMNPTTEILIELLELRGFENILDVAAGPGEPGLSLSKLLPRGSISAIDLSEKMVLIANEHARQLGISNYQSQAADASDMPFGNNHFDHVICRYGIMFFPDVKAGLTEMIRVLKPGGKLAVFAWAAPELNPFLSLMGKTIMEKINLPPAPTDAPGVFRFAKPGLAKQLLIDVGLRNVNEMNIKGQMIYESPEQFWELSCDVAGPLMEALKKAPQPVIDDVRKTVFDKTKNFMEDGKLKLKWESILITGIKE